VNAYRELALALTGEGYEIGGVSPDTERIDSAAVRGRVCGTLDCFSALAYVPWTMRGDDGQLRSYRALAVCEDCGYLEEF
jgi:hypothetical protein